MFNIGDAALEFADMTDDEVKASAMTALRNMYPDAPDPTNFMRSNWSKDQYAKMAYSFPKAGSTPEDCENSF